MSISSSRIAIVTLALSVGTLRDARGDLLVSTYFGSSVLRYSEPTGALTPTGQIPTNSGGLSAAAGITIGPDKNVYVSSLSTGQVLKYDGHTGASMGVFATLPPDPPLVDGGDPIQAAPAALKFGPDGNLYVSDFAGHNVVRFNGQNGAFIDDAATGLTQPGGLAFYNGDLYVGDFGGGAIVRVHGTDDPAPFVTAGASPLLTPNGLLFGSGGDMYVSDLYGNQILHYNANGSFAGVFATVPSTYPSDLIFDRSGNILVAMLGPDYNSSGSVVRYEIEANGTGNLLDTIASGIPGASSLVLTPALSGDTNGDGVVDLDDYNNVQNHYGQTGNPILGDTNGDRHVDIDDYNSVQNHFQSHLTLASGSVIAVPEPASAVQLALIGLGAMLSVHIWRVRLRKS